MAVNNETHTKELPDEARAWLARTLLFETLMTRLRKGGAILAGDRLWTITPAERREPAAA